MKVTNGRNGGRTYGAIPERTHAHRKYRIRICSLARSLLAPNETFSNNDVRRRQRVQFPYKNVWLASQSALTSGSGAFDHSLMTPAHREPNARQFTGVFPSQCLHIQAAVRQAVVAGQAASTCGEVSTTFYGILSHYILRHYKFSTTKLYLYRIHTAIRVYFKKQVKKSYYVCGGPGRQRGELKNEVFNALALLITKLWTIYCFGVKNE